MHDVRSEPDDKQFHGWRLLGIIAIVVGLVGLASLVTAWIVIA
jgi:hypothetical protein